MAGDQVAPALAERLLGAARLFEVLALQRPLAGEAEQGRDESRDLEKVTRLLNALAGSPNREVKQFAIERSRLVAQYLQQQQQRLVPGGGAPSGA